MRAERAKDFISAAPEIISAAPKIISAAPENLAPLANPAKASKSQNRKKFPENFKHKLVH